MYCSEHRRPHGGDGCSSRKKYLPSYSPFFVSHRSDFTHSTSSPATLQGTHESPASQMPAQ